MSYPHLFTPGKIGKLDISNRFIMTPTQTRGGDADGYVTPELIAFHRARSHDGKGPGLVIAQQTFAWPAVKLARGLALWDDRYIEKLAALASAIKDGGSRAVLQLGGSGSRLAGIDMAPSPVVGSWNMKRPREISREEMMQNLRHYAEAGRRVREAGFDGISLHGGAGKYISQFLSPWSNRRTDEFGGSPARRIRYPLMIMNAIREQAGADFPVIFRMFCAEHTEGGLSIGEGIEQIALLSAGGVDAFLLGTGAQESPWNDCPPYCAPEIPGLEDFAAVKKALPEVAVIANCGIHDPARAERILADGQADFIGICRPLLADPDYVDKVRRGRPEDIRPCLRCNNCQTWEARPALAGRGMCCTVNPALMVEESLGSLPAPAPKRVVVVGGGLAGMSAAATPAERGHQVILHEKSGEPGGQWLAASAGDDKRPFRTLTAGLVRRMKQAGVDIRLNSAPDKNAILSEQPDAVVLATGAHPRDLAGVDMLPSPEQNGIARLFGIDVLRGARVPGGKVVVTGGRYIGMECAIKLAEQGYETSLVEMNEIGRGVILRIRGMLFRRMMETGVRLFPSSSVFRLTRHQVEIAHGGSVFPIDADAVVLAIGTVPDKSLQEHDFGVPTHVIGDCRRIGDARDAVAQGTELGLRL